MFLILDKPSNPLLLIYIFFDTCSLFSTIVFPISQISFASLWASCRKHSTLAFLNTKWALNRLLHNRGTSECKLTTFGAKTCNCCMQRTASDWTNESGWFSIIEQAVIEKSFDRSITFEFSIEEDIEMRKTLNYLNVTLFDSTST